MSKPKSAKSEVIDKIWNWIDEEKYDFKALEEPCAGSPIQIEFLKNRYIIVWVEKDKNDSVLVFARINFSPEEQKVFAHLKEDKKKEFFFAIITPLMEMNLRHSVHPNPDKAEYFHIEKRIYFDGLTKDRFFDTVEKVYKGMGIVKSTYVNYLAKGSGSHNSLSSFLF